MKYRCVAVAEAASAVSELRSVERKSRAHVIVLKPKRHFAAQPLADRSPHSEPAELECSDYGRDPRFLPGWWIGPIFFTTLLIPWILLVA